MKAVLRYFSYLYQGVLALFLLAVSGIALATGPGSFRLEVLQDSLVTPPPEWWKAPALTYIVFFASLFGLMAVLLAALGKVRWLFFVWSLAVALMMIKGYVFSSYHFEPGSLTTALLLMAGALIALIGAWVGMRAPQDELKSYTK